MMIRFKLLGIGICLSCLLTACTLTPKPISVQDRYAQAQNDLVRIFSTKDAYKKLDFTTALALGLKNNLDYRIKRAEIALQAGQLQLAEMIMFPTVNISGSVYTRSNAFSSFGVTSTGQPTDVLNSTPQTLLSYREGISWNLLDFGISYLKARQQGNKILIAEEESRKQAQLLAQDILIAYWRAYSAQQLLKETRNFQKLLEKAKLRLDSALADKTIPKENILNFQASLLEGNRHLFQLKYKYDKAMFDLKHLINLPLDNSLTILAPPKDLIRAQKLEHIDMKKMDTIALVKRPELLGQDYQIRIAKHGIQEAILQALPGFTLNTGLNYNSNKFLLNQKWLDKSIDAAWNLINLASLPVLLDNAKAIETHERLKLMALTLTVITETRYGLSHYITLSNEYKVAQQQTINAEKLYILMKHRKEASLASTQQEILAKMKYITAKMDEDLIVSDLSTALGEIYLSLGADIIPLDLQAQPIKVIAKSIKDNLFKTHVMDLKHYVDHEYKKIFNE